MGWSTWIEPRLFWGDIGDLNPSLQRHRLPCCHYTNVSTLRPSFHSGLRVAGPLSLHANKLSKVLSEVCPAKLCTQRSGASTFPGAPGTNRTCNLGVRNPSLLSIELRGPRRVRPNDATTRKAGLWHVPRSHALLRVARRTPASRLLSGVTSRYIKEPRTGESARLFSMGPVAVPTSYPHSAVCRTLTRVSIGDGR